MRQAKIRKGIKPRVTIENKRIPVQWVGRTDNQSKTPLVVSTFNASFFTKDRIRELVFKQNKKMIDRGFDGKIAITVKYHDSVNGDRWRSTKTYAIDMAETEEDPTRALVRVMVMVLVYSFKLHTFHHQEQAGEV
jgi:hypothetical protein